MERHDTHALSCTSSGEHSYQIDTNTNKYSPIKNYSSENYAYSKEEEKNDWSKIFINNFKEIKTTIGLQDLSYNLNDISNNEINKNKSIINKKNLKEKSKEKSKDKKKDKNKEKEKNKIKYINIDSNKEKNKPKINNISPNNKKDKKEKKEKKEKKVEIIEDKLRVLNNGIIVKKIIKNDGNDSNILNEQNMKKLKENIIKEYLSHYDENENKKTPLYIKKPNRSFITKYCIYNNQKKEIIKDKNITYKKSYSNSQIPSFGNYNKVNVTNRKSFSSSMGPKIKRHRDKSKTILINRNKNNNLDKIEDKFSSISTITAKKLTINNNSNLFFSSIQNNNNNHFKRRPLSSYNIIKKEIDLNLKSSKIENSFNNNSFTIQKACQISSIINMNSNILNNKKQIIYENKNFLNDLKELKNAFEISIDNNNNNNMISERINKNMILEEHFENNFIRGNLSVKNRKLNSAKVRGKSYNYVYPIEPSPLFIEHSSKKLESNEIKNDSNNHLSKKCDYKKHFGCENNCPLCINMKIKNKLKEKKLSNISYYFPFKDKFNTSNSIHNSFRSNNNSINAHKINQIINHDSFINFINIKMDNMLPMDCYYNPFYLNNINNTLSIKKLKQINSAKDIKNYKKKMPSKYKALHKYFE